MIKVKQRVDFTGRRVPKRQAGDASPISQAEPIGRTPRVSKLMALAIRFDGLLSSGKVSDQSELARLGMVTQPRMTQILNLLHLAPDIQEQILFLPQVEKGRDPIHEKILRPISAEVAWSRQRLAWRALVNAATLAVGPETTTD